MTIPQVYELLSDNFCNPSNQNNYDNRNRVTGVDLTLFILFNILNFFVLFLVNYGLWLHPFSQNCCNRRSKVFISFFDVRTSWRQKKISEGKTQFKPAGEKSVAGGIITLYAILFLFGGLMYMTYAYNTADSSFTFYESQDAATIMSRGHNMFYVAAVLRFGLGNSDSCSILATQISMDVTSNDRNAVQDLSGMQSKQSYSWNPVCFLWKEWAIPTASLGSAITVNAKAISSNPISGSGGAFGVLSTIWNSHSYPSFEAAQTSTVISAVRSNAKYCTTMSTSGAQSTTITGIPKSFQYKRPNGYWDDGNSVADIVHFSQRFGSLQPSSGSFSVQATLNLAGQRVYGIKSYAAITTASSYLLVVACVMAILPWFRSFVFAIVQSYALSFKRRVLAVFLMFLLMSLFYGLMGVSLSQNSLFSDMYNSTFILSGIIHTSLALFTLLIHTLIYHRSYTMHQEGIESVDDKDSDAGTPEYGAVFPEANPQFQTPTEVPPQPYMNYYQQPNYNHHQGV